MAPEPCKFALLLSTTLIFLLENIFRHDFFLSWSMSSETFISGVLYHSTALKLYVFRFRSRRNSTFSVKSCVTRVTNHWLFHSHFNLSNVLSGSLVLRYTSKLHKSCFCEENVRQNYTSKLSTLLIQKQNRCCEFINRPPPIEVTEPGPLGSFCEGITHWEQWASHTPKLYKLKSCRPRMKTQFSYTAPKG